MGLGQSSLPLIKFNDVSCVLPCSLFLHVCPTLRFEVADVLKMSYDKNQELVDAICASLETDSWPTDSADAQKNALYNVYNEMGLKRYKLSKDLFNQLTVKDSSKEELSSHCQQASRSSRSSVVSETNPALQEAASGVVIKTEDSLATTLKAQLQETQQMANKVTSISSDFRKMKAKIGNLKSDEANRRLQECNKTLEILVELQDDLNVAVVQLEGCEKMSVDGQQTLLKTLEQLLIRSEAAYDLAKSAKQRHSSFVESFA